MEIRIISSVRIVAGMVATIAIRESLIHARNAASFWNLGIRIIVAVSLLAPIAAEPTLMIVDYRDWETDRKSTRLNSSHRSLSRMPSSA